MASQTSARLAISRSVLLLLLLSVWSCNANIDPYFEMIGDQLVVADKHWLSFDEAVDSCESRGGSLVRDESDSWRGIMESAKLSVVEFYVGAKRDADGVYRWINSSHPFAERMWCTNEPDCDDRQECAVVFGTVNLEPYNRFPTKFCNGYAAAPATQRLIFMCTFDSKDRKRMALLRQHVSQMSFRSKLRSYLSTINFFENVGLQPLP